MAVAIIPENVIAMSTSKLSETDHSVLTTLMFEEVVKHWTPKRVKEAIFLNNDLCIESESETVPTSGPNADSVPAKASDMRTSRSRDVSSAESLEARLNRISLEEPHRRSIVEESKLENQPYVSVRKVYAELISKENEFKTVDMQVTAF